MKFKDAMKELSSSWRWVLDFQNKSPGFGNLRSAYFRWWKLSFEHDLTELWLIACLGVVESIFVCKFVHWEGLAEVFFFLETRWPIISIYNYKSEHTVLNAVHNIPCFKHLQSNQTRWRRIIFILGMKSWNTGRLSDLPWIKQAICGRAKNKIQIPLKQPNQEHPSHWIV